MNKEITDLLAKIEEQRNSIFGDSIFAKNGKTTDKEIERFIKWIAAYCEKGFPDYIELVKIINGLNFNGLFVYSLNEAHTHSIYEENEAWWDNEEQQEYIFFGDDSISWYGLHKNNGKYYILDKPSGDIVNEYETFDEILIEALKVSLCLEDDDEEDD